jgi:sulfoxide reductase heme-binding subunit YedZ
MAHSAFLRSFGKHWMKPLTLAALLAPGVYLGVLWVIALSGLNPYIMGFNPVEWTHHYLGVTALRILLVTLAISPIRDITGWAPIVVIRRRIGLAAFFYALAHLLAYLWLDIAWSMAQFAKDIAERTSITLGMAALTLLVPLAITSTNGMIRRLGRKAWDRLHWLIYPLAILAVTHHFFMVKGWQTGPMIHAGILAVLLLWRVWKRLIAPMFAKPAAA